MSPRPQPPPPADADLRRLLGGAYRAYAALLDRNPGLRPEWKYYGAGNGWSLKLFHGKRNLCFVSPRETRLLIGFALGAKAVEQALGSGLPESVKQEIRQARAYVEGRAVRLEARTEQDLEPVQVLLDIKRGI